MKSILPNLPKILSSTASKATSTSAAVTKTYTEKRLLQTPPQHLYNIIIDVDAYQEFLPFCRSSNILRRSECGTMFDASLAVGLFGGGSNSTSNPLTSLLKGRSPLSSSSSSSSSWLEEEYISRVKMGIIHPPSSSVSLPEPDGTSGAHHDVPTAISSKHWIVEAKSIRSKLFHGLSSSWKLTESIPPAISSASAASFDPTNLSSRIRRLPSKNGIPGDKWCNVEFRVEMTIADPFIVAILDQVLKEVAQRQVAAFERRCLELPYIEGKGS